MDGLDFVGQNGVVFFESVPDNDPVEDAQTAREKEHRAKREKENQLRRDGPRFTPL